MTASALLDAVFEMHEARTPWELYDAVLGGMQRTVGIETGTWSVIDPAHQTISAYFVPEVPTAAMSGTELDLASIPFVRAMLERPEPGVTALTDLDSAYGKPFGEAYREACCAPKGHFQVGVGVDRGVDGVWQTLAGSRAGRDFDADDQDTLAELSRHARQAHRRLVQRQGDVAGAAVAAGLTVRQGEALQAVADGSTMRVAAARLGLTPKTLENYLQGAYRRLGVNSRLAALRELSRP